MNGFSENERHLRVDGETINLTNKYNYLEVTFISDGLSDKDIRNEVFRGRHKQQLQKWVIGDKAVSW